MQWSKWLKIYVLNRCNLTKKPYDETDYRAEYGAYYITDHSRRIVSVTTGNLACVAFVHVSSLKYNGSFFITHRHANNGHIQTDK